MDRSLKRNEQFWQENVKWNWKLGEDEVAVTAIFENSKFFKSGSMTYDLVKKQYVFTAINLKDQKEVYRGEKVENKYLLKQERGRDSLQFTLLHYNRYLWNKAVGSRKVCDVGCTLPGGFAREDTGPKCVVTQGLGTGTVEHEGKKYYICCSGCQDAFNKNPAKYVAEFNAKQEK
ncbi:MAG: TRASH domain-containing protein [Planctomycetota bacterium]|nr:TRASH domain-containing protein [Planctomycetota bacterium]MDA1137361.1 TRASH domain-containing protein [Planctomycetota bacterium]